MSRWPCKDYLKRNLHEFILWNVAPSRMLVLQVREWVQIWGKCSFAHRQVDEQRSKRSKKNDDKSAVAMLKKNDWHENVWQPVVNRDKSHERSGQPVVKRDNCNELKHGPVGRRSSNTRQLGCVFQDMKPPKPILRRSSDMQKPIQRVKFTKAIARHTKIRHQNPSLGYTCPGEPHQRRPKAPKFEDRSQEETEWQEQGAREAAWRLAKNLLKMKGEKQSNIFLTFGKEVPARIKSWTWGTRICCRLRRVDAYDQQRGLDWSWNGFFDEFEQSYDSHNRQWRSADAWRGNSVHQRTGYILDYESPRKHASSIVAWKALRWKRTFLWMDQWSKTTSYEKRDSDTMQYGELRSYRGYRLVSNIVLRFWSVNYKDTFKTGESLFHIFFKLASVTSYSNIKWQWDSRKRGSNWKWHLSSARVKFWCWP